MKQIQFINASKVKDENEILNKEKVNQFITRFNHLIKKGDRHANDALDDLPNLSMADFRLAEKLALKAGWKLTIFPDNNNTTTYSVEKIK